MNGKYLAGVVIGIFLVYLGMFGLEGFAMRMALTGDLLKEDFNDLSKWNRYSGAGTATISPAGQCYFTASASTQYRSSYASNFPLQLTAEVRLFVDDWAGTASLFLLWLEDRIYSHALLISPTQVRPATSIAEWQPCVTAAGAWHTWTLTIDCTAGVQKIYKDSVLVGTWNSVYVTNSNNYPYFAFSVSSMTGAEAVHIDYFYVDTGLKPPTVAVPLNNLQVKGQYNALDVSGFSVTLSNSSYIYSSRTAPDTNGVLYLDLKTGINWSFVGSYQGHPAASWVILPTTPTPYVVTLNFGAMLPPQTGGIRVKGYANSVLVSGFEAWWTNSTQESLHVIVTDANNGVTFSGLKPGGYTAHGTYLSYSEATAQVTVIAGTTPTDATLTFSGQPPQQGWIHVSATLDGSPVAIEAYWQNSTATGSTQSFGSSGGTFPEALKTGSYTVHAKYSSGQWDSKDATVSSGNIATVTFTWTSTNPPPFDPVQWFLDMLNTPEVRLMLKALGGLITAISFILTVATSPSKPTPQFPFIPY